MALCMHQKQNRWPQTADVGLYRRSWQIGQFHSSSVVVRPIAISFSLQRPVVVLFTRHNYAPCNDLDDPYGLE